MITIIGHGKLGLYISQKLKDQGHIYSTSRTSPVEGSFQFNINQFKELPSEIISAHTIIYLIPPSKVDSFETIKQFFDLIKDKTIIFISSTSVYGIQNEKLDEDSPCIPETSNGILLKKIEKYLIQNRFKYKILRPAGLYDKKNHPGKFLSGKENIANPNQPVNLVSREDCAEIIVKLLNLDTNLILNLVNIHHPKKSDYYKQYCLNNHLAKPHFVEGNQLEGKEINTKYSDYLIKDKLP